jgi:hypothetical protein
MLKAQHLERQLVLPPQGLLLPLTQQEQQRLMLMRQVLLLCPVPRPTMHLQQALKLSHSQ